MPRVAIVVPCYNEFARLSLERFRSYAAAHAEVSFLFVDDGSTDRTLELLESLRSAAPAQFGVLALEKNQGKAKAVRSGMLHAMDGGTELAGYWDADLATPLEAIDEFVSILDVRRELLLVVGSRVRLLGRTVERNALRHYLGRVFATAASSVLRLPIYDTQCGAKLFRVTPVTRELFAAPFATRWVFDVELLARLVCRLRQERLPAEQAICEVPLAEWRDVAGSKVRPSDFVRALTGLAWIYWRYTPLGLSARRLSARGEAPHSPAAAIAASAPHSSYEHAAHR